MKNFLIVLFVLILVSAGGYFGWRYYNQSQATDSPTVKARTTKDGFIWGVTTRPHALSRYHPTLWKNQVGLASDLEVNYVRIDWEPEGRYNGKIDPIGLSHALIKEVEAQKMRIYLSFGENGKITGSSNPYQDGYDLANQVVGANKGHVDYYQLANEISSESLRGAEFPGDKTSEYDLEKYAKIRDWLNGAIDGVKKADPQAKTVVVGQWTQIAFFDKLQEDGVNFDIIGWDWFSDMGLMKDVKISDGTYLVDKLKSFNKPVILAEVGQRPDGNKEDGFVMDEDKQNQFISEMANWSHDSGFIKGFFAFELTDVTNYDKGGYIDRYGLVACEKSKSGVGAVDHLRKVYSSYTDIVRKYSK